MEAADGRVPKQGRSRRGRTAGGMVRLAVGAACLVSTVLAVPPAGGRAQEQKSPAHAAVIQRQVNEVLADFVVVDRHGVFVRGLRPGDLRVFDNGVRQRIASLRLVTHSIQLGTQNWRAIGARPPAAEPPAANLTAIIFGPISNAGLPRARRAAVQLVADAVGPRSFLAVFRRGRGRGLVMLQPFTNDPAALDRAVQAATTGAEVRINYQRQLREYRAMLAAFSGSQKGRPAALAAAMPSWLGAATPVVTNVDVLGAMVSAAQINATASGVQRTRSQMTDLRRLVALLVPFEGRKAVVMFTERLYLRNDLKFIFRALIREANRATVSFYPVDVAGLSIRPELSALTTALGVPAQGVERGVPLEPHVGNAVNASQTVVMGELAASTGGMAVTDTNDPARFMSQIAAESTEHYELAFVPRGFSPARAPARHVVVIRIPGHRHWRVHGRNVYFARFAPKPRR